MLDGKVALITGGSRGIGKAIAMAYAREGAKVFICARKRGVLRKAAEEIRAAGGEVRWYAADISKANAVRRLVRQVCRAYGTIHILVNNAGTLGPREPIIHYPVPAWEKVMKANLTAVFLVTREALGVMARQKEGVIINLSSGVGRIGKARWGAYAAAKFGVEGLTQVVAEEVKERSEEHTSELQSQSNLVCRLLLEKKIPTQARRSRAPGGNIGRPRDVSGARA